VVQSLSAFSQGQEMCLSTFFACETPRGSTEPMADRSLLRFTAEMTLAAISDKVIDRIIA
jgi:hypothetical protein